MSPFKSFKKSGCTSSSSNYALEGANTIGVAVTSTSFETFSSGNYSYIAFRSPGQFTVTRSGKIDICVVGGGGAGGGTDVTNPGSTNVWRWWRWCWWSFTKIWIKLLMLELIMWKLAAEDLPKNLDLDFHLLFRVDHFHQLV
jgi:hypothetical protein